MSTLANHDWMPVLSRLNSILLGSDKWKRYLTSAALSTEWCGQPPAPESEILKAEARLGVTLPPSYRSFLSISNGWRPFDSFIESLLSVQEIERFRSADPERLAILQECYAEDNISDDEYFDYETPKHIEAMRTRYYPDSLLLGKDWGGESDMVLLNPHIVFPDGEWEAIFFANWVPGNTRYRSFREFVEKSINTMV